LLNELIGDEKIYREQERYYESKIYQAEVEVADKIRYLCHLSQLKYKNLDKMIETYEESCGVTYNEKQNKAIKEALTNHCFIITGGPGTGKTTIIKAIIEL